MKRIGLFVASALVFWSACGKKDETAATTPAAVTGQLALNIETANSDGASTALAFAPNFSAVTTTPSSIASGAPDSFELKVKKIQLEGTTSSGAILQIDIFKEDAGKAIKITGANVDLSSLFTVYECYKLDGSVLIPPAGKTCKCGIDQGDTLIEPNADGTCPVKLDEK